MEGGREEERSKEGEWRREWRSRLMEGGWMDGRTRRSGGWGGGVRGGEDPDRPSVP